MKQLGGLDSMFVHAEQRGLPMHISTFSVYNPNTAPSGAVGYRDIVKLYRDKIQAELPIMRSRLVSVPMNLDQPYWQEDPGFDIEYHMRHVALPEPATWEQLCELLAELQAQPLDRSRALWEAYVIEGVDLAMDVPPGSFGIFMKVHHAIMDGATGMAIFTAMHSMAPDQEAIGSQDVNMPVIGSDMGSPWQLVRKAYRNNSERYIGMVKLLGRALPIYRRVRKGIDEQRLKRLEDKPRTRFNGAVSPHRSVGRYRVDFADIKRIKSLVDGGTVNDAALTIIGGALRKYMAVKGELPEGSLVASNPINIRKADDSDQFGNALTIMNVAIRTDIGDPLQRLQAVHDESVASKTFAATIGHSLLNEICDVLYSGFASWFSKKLVESGMLSVLPPANHMVVTNVPGMPVPFYQAGCELVDSFGLGPLIPGAGLFFTVSSTMDKFSISVVACREMMPDCDFFITCMQSSFHELLALTDSAESLHPKMAKVLEHRPRLLDADESKPRRRVVAASGETVTGIEATISAVDSLLQEPANNAPVDRSSSEAPLPKSVQIMVDALLSDKEDVKLETKAS